MTEHKFGGLWTRKKLEILEKYIAFYSQALKNTPFTLHYADAFAGTGSHIPDETDTGQESWISQDALEGSVKTALAVEPGFHHYHFNDLNVEHVTQLEALARGFSGKNIHITQLDANVFVPEFCRSLGKNDRAVLFLDPYSTQLDWDTLKAIANSGKVDVWLLFPISAIIRMTPNDGERIKPEWSGTLQRLLGTDQWEQELYKPVERPPIQDMFSIGDDSKMIRRINWQELQKWVTGRLKETFAYVADPAVLKCGGKPLFSLYLLVSNPGKPAQDLADRVVRHILKHER